MNTINGRHSADPIVSKHKNKKMTKKRKSDKKGPTDTHQRAFRRIIATARHTRHSSLDENSIIFFLSYFTKVIPINIYRTRRDSRGKMRMSREKKDPLRCGMTDVSDPPFPKNISGTLARK